MPQPGDCCLSRYQAPVCLGAQQHLCILLSHILCRSHQIGLRHEFLNIVIIRDRHYDCSAGLSYGNIHPKSPGIVVSQTTKAGCENARGCCEHLAAEQPNDLRLGWAHIEVVQTHCPEQTICPGQAGIALKHKGSPLHIRPQVQRHSYMQSALFHNCQAAARKGGIDGHSVSI